MLATYSLLPIIQRFAKPMGIEIEKRDISVSGRLIAHFPDRLKPEQRIPDELAALGELAKTPEGNIIKLPNISASIPQLLECIAELHWQSYPVVAACASDVPMLARNTTRSRDVEAIAAARMLKSRGICSRSGRLNPQGNASASWDGVEMPR